MQKDTLHFIHCSAPLCLDANDLRDDMIWYPSDEAICSAQPKTGVPNWIKQQRKIVRATKGRDIGYFTLKMLKRNCVIAKGIKGIDGDKQNTNWQIKRWFEKHRTKRKLSEAEQQKLEDNMRNVRLAKRA